MLIRLSPQRRDDVLTVAKAGDVLTINGESFDFSSLPNWATIPPGEVPCEWIIGPVDRVDGQLQVTLILPHGPDPETWQGWPDPIADVADGDLDLPANTRVEVIEEQIDGGRKITTTTHRWHQEPELTVELIHDDLKEVQNGEGEEAAAVDA